MEVPTSRSISAPETSAKRVTSAGDLGELGDIRPLDCCIRSDINAEEVRRILMMKRLGWWIQEFTHQFVDVRCEVEGRGSMSDGCVECAIRFTRSFHNVNYFVP